MNVVLLLCAFLALLLIVAGCGDDDEPTYSTTCDGSNLLYIDWRDRLVSVSQDDPRCTGGFDR